MRLIKRPPRLFDLRFIERRTVRCGFCRAASFSVSFDSRERESALSASARSPALGAKSCAKKSLAAAAYLIGPAENISLSKCDLWKFAPFARLLEK